MFTLAIQRRAAAYHSVWVSFSILSAQALKRIIEQVRIVMRRLDLSVAEKPSYSLNTSVPFGDNRDAVRQHCLMNPLISSGDAKMRDFWERNLLGVAAMIDRLHAVRIELLEAVDQLDFRPSAVTKKFTPVALPAGRLVSG
jgi:hypothetical protein